eukprot:scaffold44027_cov48-Phaeocystis_antarctica.AAC.1
MTAEAAMAAVRAAMAADSAGSAARAAKAAALAGWWSRPCQSIRSCSMLATRRGPVEARTSRRSRCGPSSYSFRPRRDRWLRSCWALRNQRSSGRRIRCRRSRGPSRASSQRRPLCSTSPRRQWCPAWRR